MKVEVTISVDLADRAARRLMEYAASHETDAQLFALIGNHDDQKAVNAAAKHRYVAADCRRLAEALLARADGARIVPGRAAWTRLSRKGKGVG